MAPSAPEATGGQGPGSGTWSCLGPPLSASAMKTPAATAEEPWVDFVFCPRCDAGYKVVRVKAEPGQTDRLPVRCRVCLGPLAALDAGDVLKYTLVRRPHY